MLVKEVMNQAIAVDHDVSIKEAAKIMTEKDIGSLIILKEEEIIGIVTEKDIVKNVSDTKKKISSVMSEQVVTVDEDEDLEYAAEIMAKHKIKRLPVTSKGRLVGIITTSEIVAHVDDVDEDFFFE